MGLTKNIVDILLLDLFQVLLQHLVLAPYLLALLLRLALQHLLIQLIDLLPDVIRLLPIVGLPGD